MYYDETYINTGHVSAHTWYIPGRGNSISANKGRRLICLHAITKDGFMVGKDRDGNEYKYKPELAQQLSTACHCRRI